MFNKITFTAAIILATFATTFATTNDKDQNVAAIIAEMGITTEVDEVKLNETYTLLNLTQEGNVVTFNLPETTYTLEVTNSSNNLVNFLQNVDTNIDVDMSGLSTGNYIFKITEGGNTYAGQITVK